MLDKAHHQLSQVWSITGVTADLLAPKQADNSRDVWRQAVA